VGHETKPGVVDLSTADLPKDDEDERIKTASHVRQKKF
jgi:hypothetical protein